MYYTLHISQGDEMNRYIAKITKNASGDYFTLIVRLEKDGEENVINGYEGRHFKTKKAALLSTDNYIAKYDLNKIQYENV